MAKAKRVRPETHNLIITGITADKRDLPRRVRAAIVALDNGDYTIDGDVFAEALAKDLTVALAAHFMDHLEVTIEDLQEEDENGD